MGQNTILPTSWSEVEKRGDAMFLALKAEVQYMKKIEALMKLIVLRDIYRQGWKPDWEKEKTKYTIIYNHGNLMCAAHWYISTPLSFQTPEIRDLFFENFSDIIEQAKEFI